jgi:hypothetical protein
MKRILISVTPGWRRLHIGAVCLVAAAWLLPANPAVADVRLVIGDGRLSLDANNATLREILEEWARVGQITIFNAELVTGGPITIRLEDVSEERALEMLLRALNGYIAAPRPASVPGASRFDRIMVMPGVARPRSAGVPAPPAPAGNSAPNQVPAFPELLEPDDDEMPVRIVPAPGQRATPFRAFPPDVQPSPAPQPMPDRPAYTPRPSVPTGVPVPGMLVPTPEDPNRPAGDQPSSGS